jgi:hypothetical protein
MLMPNDCGRIPNQTLSEILVKFHGKTCFCDFSLSINGNILSVGLSRIPDPESLREE